MKSFTSFIAVAALVYACVSSPILIAAEANTATVVTIEGEMCGGCIKKMQSTLTLVPGVSSITGDSAKKTMTIVPVNAGQLSPKAVWTAIETAGKKPVKLVCPQGVFVSKPNS